MDTMDGIGSGQGQRVRVRPVRRRHASKACRDWSGYGGFLSEAVNTLCLLSNQGGIATLEEAIVVRSQRDLRLEVFPSNVNFEEGKNRHWQGS